MPVQDARRDPADVVLARDRDVELDEIVGIVAVHHLGVGAGAGEQGQDVIAQQPVQADSGGGLQRRTPPKAVGEACSQMLRQRAASQDNAHPAVGGHHRQRGRCQLGA